MFYQRDYVLRMIEMMGETLRRLGDMLDDAQRARELDRLCRDKAGMPLSGSDALTAGSLVALLPPEPRLLLSELLYARAVGMRSLSDQERADDARKAARLLSSLWEEGALCQARAARLQALLELADTAEGDDPLTAEDCLSFARFFLAGDAFAHGEDALFRGLPLSPPERRADYARRAEETLATALGESDQALALGGLPREEVAEGLKELRQAAERAGGGRLSPGLIEEAKQG